MLKRVWNEEEGVLTFEWVLLLTLLVIGVVGGLSAVRDAIDGEAGDVAKAAVSLDPTWWIPEPLNPVVGNALNAADTECGLSGGVAQGYGSPADTFNPIKFGEWRTDGTAPQVVDNMANACGL